MNFGRLYFRNCLDVLPKLTKNSVDMVLVDLPYGTTARNKWDIQLPIDYLWELYKNCLKPNGVAVLFATQPFASKIINSNQKYFRYEWIWKKSILGNFLSAKRVPLKNHENILVFYEKTNITYNPQGIIKGQFRSWHGNTGLNYGVDWFGGGQWVTADATNYPRTILEYNNDRGFHPTQKPIDLCRFLVATYTNPGDTVLDNCMGSGTTGAACVDLGRRFIGMENNLEYYRLARKRIYRHIDLVRELKRGKVFC